MIVSCESCKSRYKLDDSKITGRGAKITCPKCKHVFVVLAPPPAMADSPRPTLPPQGDAGAWADEEPTRVGREAAAAAQAAVEASSAGPPTPPEHEVVRPRASAPAETAAPPTKEAITARAAALDFRQVGVAAWKVKVRIGLVYDFSDIKTLRKYIQDGRVTPADVISHDGKAWQPIGEIPDLDVFFIEAHERLARDFAARPAPAKLEGPSPADLGNVAAELAAAAAAELDGERQVGPAYQDPFEAMKKRQRERGAGKPSAPPKPANAGTSSSALIGAAVALLLVLGAGGWWYLGQGSPPAPTAPSPEPRVSVAPSPVGEPDDRWQPVPTAPAGGNDPAAALPQARPDDCPEGFEYLPAVNGCVSRRGGPSGTPLPAPGGAAAGAQTTAAKSDQSVREETPEQVGDSAMKTQNYETAVTAYGKAVSGGSATAVIKLGEAQLRLGDLAAAQATLTKAAGSNKRAYKLLGELKEKMGDIVGAKSAYEEYCKAFPKDTAARSHLDAMGG